MTTITRLTATIIASDDEDALRRFHRYQDAAGVTATGTVWCRDAKHNLWDVAFDLNPGASANNAWVVLTSYGMSPSDGLNADWQKVAGVGA